MKAPGDKFSCTEHATVVHMAHGVREIGQDVGDEGSKVQETSNHARVIWSAVIQPLKLPAEPFRQQIVHPEVL